MVPFIEKTFPRGGKKPALSQTSRNSKYSLFKKPKKKLNKVKKKKETPKGQKKITNNSTLNLNDSLEVRVVEDLKRNVIQEGMLVLGIVNRVTNKVVNMTLPGGIQGVVNISDMSEFYVNLVRNDLDVPILQEIFKVGDAFPVKILSPSQSSNNMFNVTTDPKKINSKLTYNSIEEGFILVGNVRSEEDHGYVIDFGIEETKGFLHHNKVENGCKLQIGQIIKCAVVQRILSHGSCNVQVTMSPTDLKLSTINKTSKLPIHCFIPGFQFKVSVKKVLNQGLEISYRNDNSCKGFVHEDYLPEPFPKLDTYLNNNERLSTLLYVKPFVNFPFFMVNNQKSFKWHYEIGEIVSGKVVKTTKRGVWFRVGDNSTLTKVFVPVSGLQESKKINDEKEDIYALYPVGKEVSQIRLTRTDLIRKYYVGLADKASLKEKYFCMSDIHIGDVVPCEITHIEGNRATVSIGQGLIGHVYAQDMTDVPLKNPQKKFTPGQKVKARVVEIMDAKVITLTMKPTLVKSKDPILMDYKDAKIGEPYTGTIVKIYPNGLLVAFFNGIKGYVSKKDTPFGEGESLEDNFTEGQLIKCSVLATDHKTKMFLTLNAPGQDENSLKVKVGKKYNVKVLTVGKDMLTVNVEVKPNKWTKGLIPNQLLSKYHNLGPAYLETFKEGETFEAYCVYKPDDTKKPKLSPADLFGEFYEATPRKELKNLLQVDTILPFIYKYKDAEMNAFHFCPVIPGFGDTDAIVQNTTPDKWSLMKFKRCQIVYGKIRDVDESIKISIKLNDVWNKEIQSSLSFLDSYIIEMDRLIERQKILNKKYLKKITLGREVEGKVKELEENGAVIEINSETNGFAFGKFSENESVTGKVAWVDGAKKRVYINTQKECVADINKDQKSPLELDDGHYRARIVYVDRNLTIAALKGRGNGKLVFLPCKRHLNDFFPPIHTYKIGDIIKVHATKLNSERLLGIDHDIYRLQSKKTWKDSVAELKKSVKNLKRKNKKGDEGPSKKNCKINGGGNDVEIIEEILNESVIDEIKQEVEEDESLENFKNDFKKVNGNCNHEGSDEEIEIKSEDESDITLEKDEEKNKHKNKKDKSKKNSSSIENLFAENEIKSEESDSDEDEEGEHNREKIDVSSSSDDESEDENDKVENPKDVAISKVGFTWDVLKNPDLLSGAISKEEESSDDEEEDEEASKKKQKKTKKMTENEKRELAKKEEERLRRIEEELMDSNREPQSVDDFDRAVLANPDSSALWLKYMAFHLQGTEIEKARAVARRALKNISFREEQEKLNVWTALLNLENLYGNDETFNKTKDEALQLNDDYKIHLHILNMYAQSNKLQDAERLGFFMLKKYKDQKDVWREVAAVHYSVGKLETARNVLQKALASLDKKDHIELISKFAQLENKYGSSERAQTLYETVLGSFPKRVDVWCAYVDMMVKSKQIELARQVLERATSQVLPPKKMKTLFKKFIEFEETHGTTENVDKVREAAVEYIKNVSNLKSS